MKFLPCDAMHKCNLCRCGVSVLLPVTFVNCVKMSNRILKFSLPSDSHLSLKSFGNIPRDPLTEALNAEVCKNFDF